MDKMQLDNNTLEQQKEELITSGPNITESNASSAAAASWTAYGYRNGSVKLSTLSQQIVVLIVGLLAGPMGTYLAIAEILATLFSSGEIGTYAYMKTVYYIDYAASAAAGGDLCIREDTTYYKNSNYSSSVGSTTRTFWSLTLPIVDYRY